MTEATYAIDRLTKPWSDVLSVDGGYKAVDYEPLLDMLRAAIASSTGRTSAGRTDVNSRSVINAQAFTLWEYIDGQVRSWASELRLEVPRELKTALRDLHNHVATLWASRQIQEGRYTRFGGMVNRWADDIWALFDPPVEKEIVGECPDCGERDYFGADGGKSSAVVAYYWKGVSPSAKCRRCEGEWKGEQRLIELGRSIGATVDEEALRDMGVL